MWGRMDVKRKEDDLRLLQGISQTKVLRVLGAPKERRRLEGINPSTGQREGIRLGFYGTCWAKAATRQTSEDLKWRGGKGGTGSEMGISPADDQQLVLLILTF